MSLADHPLALEHRRVAVLQLTRLGVFDTISDVWSCYCVVIASCPVIFVCSVHIQKGKWLQPFLDYARLLELQPNTAVYTENEPPDGIYGNPPLHVSTVLAYTCVSLAEWLLRSCDL